MRNKRLSSKLRGKGGFDLLCSVTLGPRLSTVSLESLCSAPACQLLWPEARAGCGSTGLPVSQGRLAEAGGCWPVVSSCSRAVQSANLAVQVIGFCLADPWNCVSGHLRFRPHTCPFLGWCWSPSAAHWGVRASSVFHFRAPGLKLHGFHIHCYE